MRAFLWKRDPRQCCEKAGSFRIGAHSCAKRLICRESRVPVRAERRHSVEKLDLPGAGGRVQMDTATTRRGDRVMTNKSSSTTITGAEVRELLRTAARQLSAREEKTVRMRSGMSLGRNEVLPRRGQDIPEARAELLALEIELKQKLAARSAGTKGAAPAVRTKEKDKIIRALRRLK